MSKPSAVVFDLGKVLVDFDYSIAGRRIAAKSDMDADKVQHYLDHSPLLVQYETGLMTRQEFYEDVKRATSFRGDIVEFGSYFADIFSEIPEMIAIQAELKRKGVPSYIFSNTNDLAIEHIRHAFPFFANFDGYVLSYEVGAMKPDPKIYMAVEGLIGQSGANILFLDDRAENVEAGQKRGWQTIQHSSPASSRSTIEALGLLH